MKKAIFVAILLAHSIFTSLGQGPGHWRLGGNPAFPPPDGVNATNNILGTLPNLPIRFHTNGFERMVVTQGGNGVIGGRVAFGNDLPAGFEPQSRLHLHKTDNGTGTDGCYIQFTSDNTTGGSVPPMQSGVRIGLSFQQIARIQQFEDRPLQISVGSFGPIRMHFNANIGQADEGYIGVNTVGPTSRFDINGDLRIRDVQIANPKDALFIGVRHNPGNLDDLDVRRLDFPQDPNVYLDGTGNWSAPSFPVACSNTTGAADLSDNSHFDLNNFQLYFENNDAFGLNHIGIGYSCIDMLPGKLSVHQTHPPAIVVDEGTSAVHAVNTDILDVITPGNPNIFSGVYGEASGTQTLLKNYNVGGYFEGSNAGVPVGVWGIIPPGSVNTIQGKAGRFFASCDATGTLTGVEAVADGQSSYNAGITALATGGTSVNVAVRADAASAPTGGFSYAVLATCGPPDPSGALGGPNYAGFFNGDVFISDAYGPSDANLKTNIQDVFNALNIIDQLMPKTFEFDQLAYPSLYLDSGNQFGLIAQDVQNVLPELVNNNVHPPIFDSIGNQIAPPIEFLGLDYEEFIPILIAGMKEQQAMIDSLALELSSMQNCLNNAGICNTNLRTPEQNSQVEQQRLANSIDVKLRNGEIIVLNQNVPNPFAEKTIITYFIPESIGKAQIHFYNNEGGLINTVEIKERGNGQINVYADDLSSGIYTYSLIADGRFISTKRMVKE